jgi:hypothetical protein
MVGNEYFWHGNSEDVASELRSQMLKLNSYSNGRGLAAAWLKAYALYYGRVFTPNKSLVGMAEGGDSAEFALLSVNHLRNLVTHVQAIITGSRPTFNAMATSSDMASQNAARIGNTVLEHLDATRGLTDVARKVFEMGMLFGTSYAYCGWNFGSKLIGTDENDQPIYAGDLDVRALSPLDVVISPYFENFEDQQWCVIRKLANRYDLAAEYPEQAEEILAVENDPWIQRLDPLYIQCTENIPIYYAYHKACPSLPEGRFLKFIGDDVVLEDVLKNPYGEALPLVCFRPGITYGSAYGYTPVFDMIAIQEKLAEIDSAICSNQRAFSSQNIAVPRLSNISADALSGGLKIVEYDANPDLPNGGLPQILNLLATPPELFEYRNQLVADMEKLVSITPMNRGEVASGLSSGTALAIMSSQSLVANSALEGNYISFLEKYMTSVIRTVAAFMTEDELLSISGKSAASPVSSFKGSDIESIKNIKVEMSNPLQRNYAGKVDTADKLMNSGLLSHPSQYFQILRNGEIDEVMGSLGASEQEYIKYENEQLLEGQPVVLSYLDNPTVHILEHRKLVFMPEVRQNTQVLQSVMDHIIAHQDQLDQMSIQNPTLLQLIDSGRASMPQPLASTRVGQPATLGGGAPAEGNSGGSNDKGSKTGSSINANAAKASEMATKKLSEAQSASGAE